MMCTFFSATTRDGKCEKITTDHVILDRKRTLFDWLNIDRTFIFIYHVVQDCFGMIYSLLSL